MPLALDWQRSAAARAGLALATLGALGCATEHPWQLLEQLELDQLGTVEYETLDDLPIEVLRDKESMSRARQLELRLDGDAPCLRFSDPETRDWGETQELTVALERDGDDFAVLGITAIPHWRGNFPNDNPTFQEELTQLGVTLGDLAFVSADEGPLFATSRPRLYVVVGREIVEGKRDDGDGDPRSIVRVVVEQRPGWLDAGDRLRFAEFEERLAAAPELVAELLPLVRDAAAHGARNAVALLERQRGERSAALADAVRRSRGDFDRAAAVLERAGIVAAAAVQLEVDCRPLPWPEECEAVVAAMREALIAELREAAAADRAAGRFHDAAWDDWMVDALAKLRPGGTAFDRALAERSRTFARELEARSPFERLADLERRQRELRASGMPRDLDFLQRMTSALAASFGASAVAAEAQGRHATAVGEQLLQRVLQGGALDPGEQANLTLEEARRAGDSLRQAGTGSDGSLARARWNALRVIRRLAPFTTKTGVSDTDTAGFFQHAAADRILQLWLGMDDEQAAWMAAERIERLNYECLALDLVSVAEGPRTTRIGTIDRSTRSQGYNVGAVAAWEQQLASLRDQMNALDAQIAAAGAAASTPTAFHGFTHMEYAGSNASYSYYREVKDTETLSSIMRRLDAAGSIDELVDARNDLVDVYNDLLDRRPFEVAASTGVERATFEYGTQRIDYQLALHVRLAGATESAEFDGTLDYRPIHEWRQGVPGTDLRGVNESLSVMTERANAPWRQFERIAERVASETAYRQRRGALADELAARGQPMALIDVELQWCDWLLCDPEWTLDPSAVAAIADQAELLQRASALAQGE